MNKSFYLALATIILLPAQLRAEELSNKTEAVAVMDEVVVTATKTEEKRRDIANSVVIKAALDITEAPAGSLGALLANEPGIDWRTRGNYGGAAEEIQIRGMGADGTLVVVDGVTLNSPSLGSADVGQIPLNSIERIEVVKGPGSLLYGSGAMGGTVNIISKKPKRVGYAAKVEAGYGTENTYRLAAESGGFVAGDFGYYLTANRKETDGFRDNGDLAHNDIGLNLLFDKGVNFNADFNFGYVQREFGLPGVTPPVGTIPYFINGEQFYNSESSALLDHGEEHNRHSSLTFKGKAGEMLNWRINGNCAVMESYNYGRSARYGGTGYETVITNTVRGIEVNLNLHPSDRLRFLLGNEYRNFDYEKENTSLDGSGAPVVGGQSLFLSRVFTNGAFAEFNLRPLDMVRVVAGYRYETHSGYGHENVARYGLVVTPLSDTVIKVNHGKHFKAPTQNDLYWPDDGWAKGNPDLIPETGWHSDFTVEQSLLEGKIFTAISYFKWDINDKIDWVFDPSTFYYSAFNLYTYRATGWEAEVKIGPYAGVRGDFGLTLLDAEEEQAPGATRAALYRPDCQIKMGLSHYADFGLTSTMTARYVSSRPGLYGSKTDLSPKMSLDSYWTVDLRMEQELATHWRLSLLATNLLDQEYDTYLASFKDMNTSVTTQQPYPGAGRSVFASVGYSF